MRPPVTNEGFNAREMLKKARAGAYPSADLKSPNRAAEIAYWKFRAEREEAKGGNDED
jgi:hypothetical protein